MYGLWGYLLKAKALALINTRRVLEGGWYLKLIVTGAIVKPTQNLYKILYSSFWLSVPFHNSVFECLWNGAPLNLHLAVRAVGGWYLLNFWVEMQHSQNQSITQNQCAVMKSHHNYVFIQILHVWYLFSLLLFGKKIANFSKQSSRLVSLVIGAYWNPDLWKFWGNMGFKLTSVDLADGAKVSQLLPPPPPRPPALDWIFV